MGELMKGIAIFVIVFPITIMWCEMIGDIQTSMKAKIKERKQNKLSDPIESWKEADRKPGTGGDCAVSVSRRTAPGDQTILYHLKSELTKTTLDKREKERELIEESNQ